MPDLLTTFKALSDETRLKVIKLLEHGELCVCDIMAAFDMSQSKVSFHLGVLKNAGLVKSRKEGKWMHYTIDDADYFRRLLTLSVVQGMSEEALKDDRERLDAFIKIKNTPQPIARNCCTKRSAE
jgi:ArsR family transcriptional regulator, arsenate/arsenite/antimonite-responsive transcriptional repressor